MKNLIIGAGNMGEAILDVWFKSSILKREKYLIIEKNKSKLNKLRKKYKTIEILNEIPNFWAGDCLYLFVKPQALDEVAKEIMRKDIAFKVLVSIMAGISVINLKKKINLPVETLVLRAMPNINTKEKRGITFLFSNKKQSIISKIAKKKFLSLGKIVWLKKEESMHIATAIFGSGPAYFFLFYKILIEIAENSGFNKKLSKELITTTAEGSLLMCKKEKNILGLIEDVTSPGGTTEAALNVLNFENKFASILKKAINAASKKSKELSKRK